MTLREKIVEYMELERFGDVFDKSVESLVSQFRQQYEAGFGETLPENATRALALVEKALRDTRSVMENAVAEIYEEQLTESDVDALVAFGKSDIGQRIKQIAPTVQAALSEAEFIWGRDAIASVEGDLMKLLGTTPTANLRDAKIDATPTGGP